MISNFMLQLALSRVVSFKTVGLKLSKADWLLVKTNVFQALDSIAHHCVIYVFVFCKLPVRQYCEICKS